MTTTAPIRASDLQHEARAHIAVQAWIDGGGLAGRAFTVEGLCEIHRRFGDLLESLAQPDRLRTRILLWAQEEVRLGLLPQQAGAVLESILYRGELPRTQASKLVGTGDRQARRVVSDLIERGVVVSDGPRAPLRLAFPATVAGRWLPGLFPEQPQ